MTLVQTEPKKIYYGEPIIVSDMQGPAPDGFHVPLRSEWVNIINAGVSLGAWSSSGGDNFKNYLKLPYAGCRYAGNGGTGEQGSYGNYWTSLSRSGGNTYCLRFDSTNINPSNYDQESSGYSIRPFKNTPTTPDSSWTVLKQGTGTAGIYHNSTLGLISISSDGTTRYTIADKNLGATTVYSNGNTLSEANCGKYYQRGNNYGFPRTGSITTSNTQVNASTYGPGNYYSSSTFINVSGNWDSSSNTNLRGGETQGTSEKAKEIKAVYLGENKVRPSAPFTPGANTIYYFPLDTDATDHSGNGYTLSNTGTAATIGRNFTATVNTSPAGSTISNPAFRMAWVKVNNVGYESRKVNSMGMNVSDGLAIHFMNGWVGSSQPIQINFDYVNGSSYSSSSWQPGITTGNWYCIAFQKEGTDTVAYCNGVRHVMASGKTGYYWGAPSYLARESSASSGFSVDLSEIIMESATWTSTKVIDYFNATKSKYGVS